MTCHKLYDMLDPSQLMKGKAQCRTVLYIMIISKCLSLEYGGRGGQWWIHKGLHVDR